MSRGVPPLGAQRHAQWQRSTFVGAAGGRVANAYPVSYRNDRPLPARTPGTAQLWYVGSDATSSAWPGRSGPTLTPSFGTYTVDGTGAVSPVVLTTSGPGTELYAHTPMWSGLRLRGGFAYWVVASLPRSGAVTLTVSAPDTARFTWVFYGGPTTFYYDPDSALLDRPTVVSLQGGGPFTVWTEEVGPTPMQIWEFTGAVGAAAASLRQAGIDRSADMARFGTPLVPFPVGADAVNVSLGYDQVTLTAPKVWEIVLILGALGASELAHWRSYLSTKYGVPA